MSTDPKNQPDALGLAHQRQHDAVTICRDVYGGTLRMRERGEKYLPQFPKEKFEAYQARLRTSVLYNAFKRTVRGLVGMVFRKEPQLGEDVPAQLVEHAENIDLAGRNLAVFAQDAFTDAMVDGHVCIFVDMPAVDPDAVPTLAHERAMGLRPYWTTIPKSEVLRFSTQMVNGRAVLTEFVYRECAVERDGQYGEREVQRIRIYRLTGGRVEFQVFTKRKDESGKESWTAEKQGTMSIDEIPVATAYTSRVRYLESEPPLLDLALENVLHYQTRSDRCNNLHIAATPIPVLIGAEVDEDGKTQVVATNQAIQLPLGGDAKYLEPTGAALDHSQRELQDIEARMAALGLAMLQRETRAAETAEAKRIDKSASDSQLAAAAIALGDAIEEAFRLHAKWLKIGEGGGSVSVNDDFERQEITPQMVKELREMVGAGQLRLETMWDILERGELLPSTFDPEAERDGLGSADLDQLPRPAPRLDPAA